MSRLGIASLVVAVLLATPATVRVSEAYSVEVVSNVACGQGDDEGGCYGDPNKVCGTKQRHRKTYDEL